MSSLFDSAVFNERLFPARGDLSRCPPNATDLYVDVEAGVRLHGRGYWCDRARATFVVFHGNGEVVSDYDSLSEHYHRVVGAHLVVFGYRGYGQSSGHPTLRAAIADSQLVLHRLPELLGGRAPGLIIVLGRSLGGACAAETAAAEPPLADGVVLESAPGDWRGIIERRGLEYPGPLAARDQVFDPAPKLRRSRLPVLVLHGSDDSTIRPHEARMNLTELRHPASQLEFIPGRGHGDVLFDPLYYDSLRRFVDVVGQAKSSPEPTLRRARSAGPLLRFEQLAARASVRGGSSFDARFMRFWGRGVLRVLHGVRRALRPR